MEVEVEKVVVKVKFKIDIDDLIDSINKKPLLERWKYLKKLQDKILLDDIDKLEPGVGKLIVNFLEIQLQLFQKKMI